MMYTNSVGLTQPLQRVILGLFPRFSGSGNRVVGRVPGRRYPMSPTLLAASGCYALAALVSMVFGAVYLVRSQFMPYHEEAMGLPWGQLDQRLQTLLLALMRTTGGGLLAVGISAAILLLIPFRAGEPWALYAIPAIGLVGGLPGLYATTLVRSRTHAHTPVAASATGIVLLIVGFALSLI